MTDVALSSEGFGGFDLHPSRMPDLFRGERLVVLGRYAKGGRFPVSLHGRIAGEVKEHLCEIMFEEASVAHSFVPALWAQRRIGFLLDEIRLKGQNRELADEVMRLGREHGVVTPWTSHLILEDGPGGSDDYFLGRTPGPRGPTTGSPGTSGPTTGGLGMGGSGGRTPGGPGGPSTPGPRGPGDTAPPRPSGPEAVELSVALKRIREGATLQDLLGAHAVVRRVQGKVFFRVSGAWIDGALTRKALEGKDRVRVKAFSDEYFRLLREQPELQPWFALGDRVIVALGERLFEVEGA
jgi:Ca-activated chloride channel family protein